MTYKYKNNVFLLLVTCIAFWPPYQKIHIEIDISFSSELGVFSGPHTIQLLWIIYQLHHMKFNSLNNLKDKSTYINLSFNLTYSIIKWNLLLLHSHKLLIHIVLRMVKVSEGCFMLFLDKAGWTVVQKCWGCNEWCAGTGRKRIRWREVLGRVFKTCFVFALSTHVVMCFFSFKEGMSLRGRWWEVWGVSC